MDEDEISFKIIKNESGKKVTLIIESNEKISNSDYILYIESLLTDLIRAEKQLEAADQLH